MLEIVERPLTEVDVVWARMWAAEKHKGQVRKKSGLPYTVHLHAVEQAVVQYSGLVGNELLHAQVWAQVHDTLENTGTVADEIEQEFGKRIRVGACAITKRLGPDTARMSKKKLLEDSVRRIKETGYVSLFLVKHADRWHNLHELPDSWSVKDRVAYALGGMHIYQELYVPNNDLCEMLRIRAWQVLMQYYDVR